VEAKSIPATAVGGDFYDFPSQSGDWLGVAVGDVSGKGVPAALFMAKLISDLRFTAQRHGGPAAILRALNAELASEARRGMFVTLQYLLLDAASGTIRAANGGNVPLLWHHAQTGETELVDLPGGPPLGIVPETEYQEGTLALSPGDRLVLLTDGVLEAADARGEAFGFDRLAAAVASGSPVATVLDEVLEFSADGARRDDLTLLQLTWCG
jgi:sigma-B regulation protein RsbU (phosphoserine phosphatase)